MSDESDAPPVDVGGSPPPSMGIPGAGVPPSLRSLSMAPGGLWNLRRLLPYVAGAAAIVLAYQLRGVFVPLFLAFLVAYALDPVVDRLVRLGVPRSVGAPLVMVALVATVVTLIFVGVPFAVDEFRTASQRLPQQLDSLYHRIEDLLWARMHYRMPETWSDLFAQYGSTLRHEMPDAARVGSAVFGTVGIIFVVLGTLIIPIFALYLLGDFNRIVARAALLVPRRYARQVTAVVGEIHVTLGRYVRGQLITCLLLATLYAAGLAATGIRLAVPIGVLTGMLAFVPYVGLATGTVLAVLMALLDWHSSGQLAAVVVVMATVGVLDGMVITPRIVGGSVGLKPLEVLLTMMASATLFGFLGVLLAVPIGAVLKILLHRAVEAYLGSSFYRSAAPPAGANGVVLGPRTGLPPAEAGPPAEGAPVPAAAQPRI